MDVSDLFDEEKKVDPFEKEDEIQSAIESAVPSPQPGRTDTSSATINHNQKDLSSTVKPPFCPLLKPLEKSYTALTQLVTPDLPLISLAEKVSGGQLKSSNPTMLIGLHTCGDLASTALRLFANTDALRGVCVVGCCYNHISEHSSPSQREHASSICVYLSLSICLCRPCGFSNEQVSTDTWSCCWSQCSNAGLPKRGKVCRVYQWPISRVTLLQSGISGMAKHTCYGSW